MCLALVVGRTAGRRRRCLFFGLQCLLVFPTTSSDSCFRDSSNFKSPWSSLLKLCAVQPKTEVSSSAWPLKHNTAMGAVITIFRSFVCSPATRGFCFLFLENKRGTSYLPPYWLCHLFTESCLFCFIITTVVSSSSAWAFLWFCFSGPNAKWRST